MSNRVNPQSDTRQVPVETYKCSQCNFYTNHEYYLQQHSFTHGLQCIMEHHKHNHQSYNPTEQEHQSYIKVSPVLEAGDQAAGSELFNCTQCIFKTDQEAFFKEHLSSHGPQYGDPIAINAYASYKILSHEYNVNNDDGFVKTHLGGSSSAADAFGAREFESAELDNVGLKLQGFRSTAGSFESVTNTLKCPVNFVSYEIQAGDDLVRDRPSHMPENSNAEPTFRCLNCNFQTSLEKEMKSHIKSMHEKGGTSTLDNNNKNQPSKEVYRCNNCDYETNLKAFLKRHMLLHTVKVEVKDEVSEKYQCTLCDFETEHEKFLKRHELSHQESRRFKCQKCSFETLYTKMFLNHLHGHRSKKPTKPSKTKLKCDQCAYETNSREMLDVHKKIEHVKTDDIGLSLFNCAYCKYKTNWEPCLKRHIQREHLKDANEAKEERVPHQVPVKVEDEPQATAVKDLFRCHDCDFSSKSKQYLVLHLKRSHIKAEQVERPRRGRSAKLKVEQQKDSKLFSCKFRNCTFQTSIKSNYVHHLRKHQSQNPQRIMFHFCDLCDFIGKSEESLEDHKKRKHLNQNRPLYGCNQCDFKTVFKYSLKTHSIKHKVYTCDVCDLEIASAYALVKHRKTHQVNPKNRIYLCDVCGFQSKNDRSLKMHKKTHNPEFKCPDCPFQTHSKVNFQNHCINHKSADEVTMFPCPHCSYQSRLKRNLAWHMKRHADPSKAQIFKCPSCEYQTFTNAQLKSHLMVHKSKEEVVMLKCDFCTFETKRKSNMVQHRLRHLKDSPDVPLLSCPDCNYTTVAKRHLNKHRKTHNVNPDKMFQCTYCPYKIHRKIYLMRHMENHKTVETFGNDPWGGQRYTFPPQPHLPITGVTVVPNLGQNLQNMNHGHLL